MSVYKQYVFMSEFSVLWIIMDTANFFHVTETMGFSSAII